MTLQELEKRVVELEAERDRWREMAERLSKLVPVPAQLLPQLLPVVSPYRPFPADPLIVPFGDPQRWPPGVVITCETVRPYSELDPS